MPRCFPLFCIVAFLLTACGQSDKGGKRYIIEEKEYPTEKEYTADLPPPPAPYTGPKKYCFEKREGENGEDVTELQLVLDNDSISGQMDYLYAKRAPVHGNIDGMMMGTVLNFVLTYISDGAPHKERMICKFDKDQLFKKTGTMVEKDSVLELQTPSKALFVLSMERVKCK